MTKRVLALLLAGLMCFGLFGCGGGDDASTPPADGSDSSADGGAPADGGDGSVGAIGFSMPTRDQFWTSLETAATEYASAQGIEFNVLEAQYDIATQISHVQTWEADGYSAAIVGLTNNDSAADVLAVAGDMKIVFVNRQPSLDVLKDGEVVYVGTDENLYGIEQGNFLTKVFEDEGKTDVNVAIFMGELGLDNTTKRTESVKKQLKDNGINVNVVFENTAKWDRAEAMNLFSQFMGTGESVDAVICNNDEMALGVIEAMMTNGDNTVFCPVVGIDATNVGCQAIQEGTMACSVFQDPVAQGEGAVKCAIGLVKGETIDGLVDNYYNISPSLVTKDNVADFM